MKLSFKKRSIKKFTGLFRPYFIGPVLLKLVLLLIVFGSTFYFKVWAERQQEYRFFSLPSVSVIKTVTEKIPSLDESVDARPSSLPGSIDVNSASVEELESLPGIGPQLAGEIVRDRLRKGPFLQRNDLLRVKGVGPKKLRLIESYLRFKG